MAGAFAIGTDLESSGGKEPTIHTTLVGGSGGSTTVVVRAPYFSLVLGAAFRGRTGTTPSRVAVPAGFTALTAGAVGVLAVADVAVACATVVVADVAVTGAAVVVADVAVAGAAVVVADVAVAGAVCAADVCSGDC